MQQNILIAEADPGYRKTLHAEIERAGFHCEPVDSARGALVKLSHQKFQVAIVDLGLPDMDGIELFRSITHVSPESSVIIITDMATVQSSIDALRLGAVDYMVKPVNFEELVLRLKRVLQQKDSVARARYLHQLLNQRYDFSNIIARSQPMQKVCDLIRRVAATDSNVLIRGNSGTGKELVARAIHLNSRRREHNFVTVNCGAISESLFESELFGHKKGAFTNAIKDKDGLFKVASGGTLFLDEIACLPISMQSKLLRAIEFNSITPIGATEPLQVDVRFIASTHHRLNVAVEKGQFRDDLFYRLNVFEIDLPSLKERREDIPILVQHFVDKYAKEMSKRVGEVDPEVLKVLTTFEWKGEVRELENVVERAMIFCEGDTITMKDLPDYVVGRADEHYVLDYNKTLKQAVKEFERHFILTNLKRTEGHRRNAFKAMGLSESSFYRKVEDLGLRGKVPTKPSANASKTKIHPETGA